MGRRKIEIQKIQSKEKLNVCFSKRRTGLFKKAEKLGHLTGAKTAIVILSPAGKIFKFGDPLVDSIIDRYLLLHHQNRQRPEPTCLAVEDDTADVDLDGFEDQIREVEPALIKGKENGMRRMSEQQQQQKESVVPSSSLIVDENLFGIPPSSSSYSYVQDLGVGDFENPDEVKQPGLDLVVDDLTSGIEHEQTWLEELSWDPNMFFDIDELLDTLSDPLPPEESTDQNQQQQDAEWFEQSHFETSPEFRSESGEAQTDVDELLASFF
uniref:MADS-box domain-containing protein n=1 Tax=Nelumbo nucifera TaxID=4432 RepID=A0A822YDD5_NELNU|nr:TPA_asm: hypothetical protein HUJ06_030534 [Nelumbo nucifera]